MKKIVLTLSLALASLVSQAADIKPYIEGSVGYANPDKTQSNWFYDDQDLTNKKYTGKYDSDTVYGIEFGFKDVIVPNLRLSAEFSTAKFDQKASSHSVWANGYIEPETELTSNRTKLYMLNAYYDFDVSEKLKPFVGVGLGAAKNEDVSTEFAWQVSLGGKYYLVNNVYIGAKASYIRQNGPTYDGNSSVKFDDSSIYTAKALIGYEF